MIHSRTTLNDDIQPNWYLSLADFTFDAVAVALGKITVIAFIQDNHKGTIRGEAIIKARPSKNPALREPRKRRSPA
ncbi:MAG: hypothetical protein WA708_06465 [Acidobacteriaceae bacterium]